MPRASVVPIVIAAALLLAAPATTGAQQDTAPDPAIFPPASTIDPVGARVRAERLVRFTGRATGDVLQRVEIAVLRLDHGARAAGRRPRAACRRLSASGRLRRAVPARAPCVAAGFLTASGTARWTFNLLRPLPKGRYVIVSRARDRSGIEPRYSAELHNRRAFTVR